MLDGLPLATIEGEGTFRIALADFARKQGIQIKVQVECSSFPLAARAVTRGNVGAILPSIAAADLQAIGAEQIAVSFLKEFDREMCLATSPRLIRIRPALQKVATVFHQDCRF